VGDKRALFSEQYVSHDGSSIVHGDIDAVTFNPRLRSGEDGQLWILDLESEQPRPIYSALSGVTISLGGFSADKRTLYFAMSSQTESDIWVMTLPQ
jgi:hypothetical protein